jgi:hypothetical protein
MIGDARLRPPRLSVVRAPKPGGKPTFDMAADFSLPPADGVLERDTFDPMWFSVDIDSD